MKTYLVLNYAPRHEDVGRIGGMTPLILNLGTGWRWVFHDPAALP